MAKVKGPLFSVSASGALAGRLTFRDTKHGPVVTRFHSPGSVQAFSPSQAQLDVRENYRNAVAAWNALSLPEKETYKERARPEKISGWNLFFREYAPVTGLHVIDDFGLPGQSILMPPWLSADPGVDHRVVSGNLMGKLGWVGFVISYYSAPFINDQYAETQIASVQSFNFRGPVVRYGAGFNCYALTDYSGFLRIVRMNLLTPTVLAEIPSPLMVAGDWLRLEVIGSDLTAKLNGVTLIQVTDPQFGSGFPGVTTFLKNDAIMEFRAGDL